MGTLNAENTAKQDLNDSGCVQDASVGENGRGYPHLMDLSDDVLLCILQYLSPMDLKALGHTCSRLGVLICDRTLWTHVDARTTPMGRERLQWMLTHCLSSVTTELKISGYANKDSRCLGIQDLFAAFEPDKDYLNGSTHAGSPDGADVEHFLLRMWYPHLPRFAVSPRWPDKIEADVKIIFKDKAEQLAAENAARLEPPSGPETPDESGKAGQASGNSGPNSEKTDAFGVGLSSFDACSQNAIDASDLKAGTFRPTYKETRPPLGPFPPGYDDYGHHYGAKLQIPREFGDDIREDCKGPQFTLTKKLMRDLKSTCPNLTSLAIEYCNLEYRSTNLRHFPNKLKKLSLRGCRVYNLPLNTSYLGKVQERLPELQYLDVSECDWFEPASLMPLSKLAGLTELYMRDCKRLTECVAYASLATRYGFRQLRYLDVSECDWFEPASLMPLSKLAGLTELYMRDCKRLTECVAYASLATRYGFRQLRILDVRGSPLADSEVSAVGWLPRLEELYVSPPADKPDETEHTHTWNYDHIPHNELDDWETEEPEYFKLKEAEAEQMSTEEEKDEEPNERHGDVMFSNPWWSHERRIIVIQPNANRQLEEHYPLMQRQPPQNNGEENRAPPPPAPERGRPGVLPAQAIPVPVAPMGPIHGAFDILPGERIPRMVRQKVPFEPPSQGPVHPKKIPTDPRDVSLLRQGTAPLVEGPWKPDLGGGDYAREDSVPSNLQAGPAYYRKSSVVLHPYPPIPRPIPNPHMGPMGPINPHMGAANFPAGLGAYRQGPVNPQAGAPNPRPGPGNQQGPANPQAGPSNQQAGPSNPPAGPSNPRPDDGEADPSDVQVVPEMDRPGPPTNRPSPPMDRPVPPMNRPVPPMNRPVPPMNRPGPPMERPIPPMNRPGPPMDRQDPANQLLGPTREELIEACRRVHALDALDGPYGPPQYRHTHAMNMAGVALFQAQMGYPRPRPPPANAQPGPMNAQPGPSNAQAGPSNPQAPQGPSNPQAGPSNSAQGPSNSAQGPPNSQAGLSSAEKRPSTVNDDGDLPKRSRMEGDDVPNRPPIVHIPNCPRLMAQRQRLEALGNPDNQEPGTVRFRRDLRPIMQIDVDVHRHPPATLPAHIGYNLVTDSALLRFGRAENENVNYVHIGRNGIHAGSETGSRPDRSNLRILSVTGYRQITDRSLEHLVTAAPFLVHVDFSDTNVTPRGVEMFRAIRPECEVIFSQFRMPPNSDST